MSEFILTGVADGIMQIEICRPKKRNALNSAMYTSLRNAFARGEEDAAVRVILLTGQPGAFCAGNDMQDFLDPRTQSADGPVLSFMQTMSTVGKPIIAAVSGNAIGVGATMLLHCDLVYAADSARFQFPFVPLGICPEFATSLLLPRLAGHHRAAELLYFGEPFDAMRACEIGLVNAVRGEGELPAFAMARAQELAARPLASLSLTKRLLKERDAGLLQEVITDELKHVAERVKTPEARDAFLRFTSQRTGAASSVG